MYSLNENKANGQLKEDTFIKMNSVGMSLL